MRTIGRVVGLSIVVAIFFPNATARTGEARFGQQPCGVASLLPPPPAPRPHYVLRVQVLPGLRTVKGALTVTFTAPTERGTDRLILRLWPNGGALRERRGTLVWMNWRLLLPRETGLRMKGGGRSVRLGSFFPLLAWDGNDWALDPSTKFPSAEAWTTPIADFDVRVTQPAHLRVLASGQQIAPGKWRAQAVRDFTLALGRFEIVKGTAHVPASVRVTVGLEAFPGAEPVRLFLRRAILSLERYSALYGPYPWHTYTVVTMADLIGLTGGLEYPTLVYQPATSENVPHETAHQWFYSLVGNDQARDPWLDEGLATWAEAAVNGAPPFPDATIPPEVTNRIGEPMSFWDQFDTRRYFLGAYLQSSRALLSLGPRSQVGCAIRLYVIHNAYRIARPHDLLDALQTFFPDAEQKLEAYGAHF